GVGDGVLDGGNGGGASGPSHTGGRGITADPRRPRCFECSRDCFISCGSSVSRGAAGWCPVLPSGRSSRWGKDTIKKNEVGENHRSRKPRETGVTDVGTRSMAPPHGRPG